MDVNNGNQAIFWEDHWAGSEPLMQKYHVLYKIVRKKNAIVSQVISKLSLNVSFRRALIGEKLVNWLNLVSLIVPVALNEDEADFVWNLNRKGFFSVQYFYKDFLQRDRLPGKFRFWKTKLHLKIKVSF